MNKGSIVERLCSDLDRKEPRYKSPTLSNCGYIHCNFRLNPQVVHGDMKENVSGCFFLNTV